MFSDYFFCAIRRDIKNENAGFIFLPDNLGNFCPGSQNARAQEEIFGFIFYVVVHITRMVGDRNGKISFFLGGYF